MLTENMKYFTMIGLSPDIGFTEEEAAQQTYEVRRFLGKCKLRDVRTYIQLD